MERKNVMLIMASVALTWLAVGCGQHESDQASTGTTASVAAVTDQAVTLPASPAVARAESSAQAQPRGVTSADSLPPDVVASVADTMVVPGQVIEITAEGSDDVSQVTLVDGLGESYSFAFDSTARVWHVFYRVPVKLAAERLGLSVTARNNTDHWRRVWIFLRSQAEDSDAEPDSVPGS